MEKRLPPWAGENQRFWTGSVLHYTLQLSQIAQHFTDIGVKQDGLLFKPAHGEGFAQVEAGVGGFGILGGHTEERHFDDSGRVAADAQFQKQDAAVSVPLEKILIPPGGGIPALVLHESVVTAQIHGHGPAAPGAAGDQFSGNTHVHLLCDHPADSGLVVIGGLMAGLNALPEAVIALSVEQPRLIKTSQLKLMVHVGGQNAVISVPDQRQQVRVRLSGRQIVAVIVDMSAPPGPVLLQRGKGIETAGIYIGNAVFLVEVGEVFQKSLAAVRQTGGGGKAGACADEDGVRALNFGLQPLNYLPVIAGRFRGPGP